MAESEAAKVEKHLENKLGAAKISMSDKRKLYTVNGNVGGCGGEVVEERIVMISKSPGVHMHERPAHLMIRNSVRRASTSCRVHGFLV